MEQFEVKKNNFWLKRLNLIMEAIWLLIIFLIPVYLDRNLFNPWEPAKNILLQILTEILLFIYLVKVILLSGVIRYRDKIKYFLPAMIFIVVLGVSTIFSRVPWFSFWGSWERRMGYLAWLHFFIFGLIVSLNLKTEAQKRHIIIAILAATAVAIVYGFLQIVGLDPFAWSEEPIYTHRVFASIGQPNFYASWLLLVIPIIIYSFSIFKKFYVKSFIVALLLGSLISLILTQSRGGWFGFVIEIFFSAIFFAWLKRSKKAMISILAIFLLMSSLLIYLNFHPLKANPNDNYFIARLKTITDIKVFGKYRLMHWQASLDIIKKHFVIGNGLGSQRFNLPKYYRPEFAVYEAPNIYLDYAHNDILDILLAAGLFGLLSYLFLIIATFYYGLKSIKKFLTGGFKEYGLELMALIGLLGYLASIMLSFHVMSTLLYFWLFIAIIFSVKINNAEMAEAEKISAAVSVKKMPPLKLILISILLISAVFSLWQFNLTLYLSSHFLLKATVAKLQNNWQTMIQNNQLAVKFQPDNPFFRFQFANFLLDAATSQKESTQKLKLIDAGIQNIEAIPDRERPVEALNLNAWLLTEKTNITRDSSDYKKAEKLFQVLADFAPGAALTYNNWCTLEGYVGQTDKAMAMCQKALSLYPNIDHPDIGPEQKRKIIEEEVQVYGKLASVYFSKKDYQNALMNYQQILHLDPAQIVPWLKMAQIYYLQNNISATVSALTHGYIRDPHNPIWANNLSVLYQKQKDAKQAKFWSERTKEIQAGAEPQTTY